MYIRSILRWLSQSPDGLLHEVAAGAGSSAPGTEGAAAPAAGSPASPTSPAAGPAAAAGSASAPAGAVPAGKTYSEAELTAQLTAARAEARRGFIPGHRHAESTAKIKELEGKIAALAGVTPKSEAEIADAELRAAFAAKFPDIASLTAEDVKGLRALLADQANVREGVEFQYQRLADRTLESLCTKFADRIGAGQLTDEQRQGLYAAFMASAQADPTKFKQRYDREDPKLIDEFIERFNENFFEPARRQAVSGRPWRPVPAGGNSRPVVSQEPKYKPSGNLDAAMDKAAEMIRERGGFATQRG